MKTILRILAFIAGLASGVFGIAGVSVSVDNPDGVSIAMAVFFLLLCAGLMYFALHRSPQGKAEKAARRKAEDQKIVAGRAGREAYAQEQDEQQAAESTDDTGEAQTVEEDKSPDRFDFVAIDFETATGSNNSACAVGIVAFRDLKPVDVFYSYIKPPDNIYSDRNIAIHGITPDMTEHSPTLTELWPKISRFFAEHVPVVAHNAQFDMSVLRLSTDAVIPDFVFIDSIPLAQSLGVDVRDLHEVADALGIEIGRFNHHDAKDDASLCALITAVCLQSAGCISLWEFLARFPHMVSIHSFEDLKPTKGIPDKRFTAPKTPKPAEIVPTVPIGPDAPLYRKNFVFTGELSIDREEAMQLVVNAGGQVKTGVSRKTDYLVVGKQIYTDAEKSSKEKKAEEYNSSGEANIRIINETEFLALVGYKE